MTINDIRNEGWTVMNTISLVTDVASIVIPFVPAGVSHALRAAKLANKAVNAVDTAGDAAKLINKADDFVSAGTKLGDDLKKAANWVKQENGFFDVMVHGSPNSFHVKHNGNWVDIDHRTLATFIKKSEWQGEPIRLLSCSSGACPAGVAQNLANKLKVPVKAPDDTLWVYNTGKLTIGPKPFVNTGSWKIFTPKRMLE